MNGRNLLWNWWDPANGQLECDGDDTNDPDTLAVVWRQVPEDDGENDTTKVTHGTSETRHDTVGMWVHVRHKGVTDTVATLKEESQTSEETEHGSLVVGVEDTDGDCESTEDDSVGVKKNLLAPDGASAAEGVVSGETTERTADDVEKTEHGSPVTRFLETETIALEVDTVPCTEDGVDGKLSTERAEVMNTSDPGLRGSSNVENFLASGLADNLALGGFVHLFGANLSFAILVVRVGRREEINLLVVDGLLGKCRVAWVGNSGGTRLLHVERATRSVDDGTLGGGVGNAEHVVLAEVVINGVQAVFPATKRGVGAEEEQASCDNEDEDTRDNKVDTPGDVGPLVLVSDEGVVNGRHDEVGNTSTSVTETGSDGVGGTDNVLVEEPSHPYLARNERTTEDTDEETVCVKTSCVLHTSSTESGNGTSNEADSEGPSRSEKVTKVTSKQTDEKTVDELDWNENCHRSFFQVYIRCDESDNVRVAHLRGGQLQVLLNDIAQ